VWLVGDLYPRTLDGLATCYIAAIPFFRNTLAGDAGYTVALFGGFALAQRYVPSLDERRHAGARIRRRCRQGRGGRNRAAEERCSAAAPTPIGSGADDGQVIVL